MKTYNLGAVGDRVMTVTKAEDDEHVVTLKIKDEERMKSIEFPPHRWASFRQKVEQINDAVKYVAEGVDGVNVRLHLGGGYYVGVTSGYRCVDFRKFYKPYGSMEGHIMPTKRGISLRLDEWSHLCNLIDSVNTRYPSLGQALPCYYEGDHHNQLGWIDCTECFPYGSDTVAMKPLLS